MLVQQTPLFDPETRLPIVVVDTTKLNGTLPDEHTVRKSIKQLPESDFTMIFFASHSPKFSVSWLQSVAKLISRDIRKQLKKLYVVHENWVYKTLQKTLGSLVSPKFTKKIVYIRNLSELAQHCDITLLNIARDVYLHDLDQSSHIVVPKHSQPIYGFPVEVGMDFFPQIFDFLYVAPITPKSFEKTGGSELVWVLKQAFDRNQTIDLTEYGPQMVIAAFKLYLFELPSPLLPIDSVPLPIAETDAYWAQLSTRKNWPLILSLHEFFRHAREVYHIDAKLIATSFGPALCGLKNPNKDEDKICLRVVRLLASYVPTQTDTGPVKLPPKLPPKPQKYSIPGKRAVNVHTEIPKLAAPALAIARPTSRPTDPGSPLKGNGMPMLKAPKPLPPVQRTLKPKPSMSHIRGLRVGEITQFYENI